MKLFNTFVSEEAKQLVQEVLDSGFLNQGQMVVRFEQALSDFGLENPSTVNSCTAGLHLALECCNVRGKEVILPAQTFIATGLAVLMAGGTPIFVDIELNGNISYNSIKASINENTGAIICVHWGGVPADVIKINELAKENNIPVIEDAAHAFGAEVNGHKVGTISDFTVFSFQSIKLLTTGDGGAICCKNPEHLERIQKLKWFGIDKNNIKRAYEGHRLNDVTEISYKYHMNNIAAALGVGNLPYIKNILQKRRLIADYYRSNIHHVDHPKVNEYDSPSYWLYTIRSYNRKKIIEKLRNRGIECSTVDQRIDNNYVFPTWSYLPEQEIFDLTQLSIPCHEKLTKEDIELVTDTINSCT